MLSAFFELLRKTFFFTGYFTTKSYPKPLAPTEERCCLEKMAQGDGDAREKLIMHNMRLVAHVAKKYYTFGEQEDLLSIGSIGLIKGIESFSFSKGTTLATYLARCIENEILMMLRSAKRYKNTVYLGEQLGVDSEGDEYTLMEMLSQDEDSVYRQAELSILKRKLLLLIKETLTKREQTIIVLRFGLCGTAPLTQMQTAAKLGISRSYVSRIETKSLKKLKSKMNAEFNEG